MSKGTGATPAMTWKSGVLAVILLLGIIGPLLIVSWMWGGPGFCPAVPMMSQMENINDKMSKPNPDGGADLSRVAASLGAAHRGRGGQAG